MICVDRLEEIRELTEYKEFLEGELVAVVARLAELEDGNR